MDLTKDSGFVRIEDLKVSLDHVSHLKKRSEH